MGEKAYIADNPLLLGLRWLRMELSLSVAIVTFGMVTEQVKRKVED